MQYPVDIVQLQVMKLPTNQLTHSEPFWAHGAVMSACLALLVIQTCTVTSIIHGSRKYVLDTVIKKLF